MFIRLWLFKKNHYRLIAVDLSEQKELLEAEPKAIQQVESVGQLKNVDNDYNAIYADGAQSMFTVLEKIKETRLTFSQGTVTVL